MSLPETPDLDKYTAIAMSEGAGELVGFIDWMIDHGMWPHYESDEYGAEYVHLTPEELMAEYFEIDLTKVNEQRDMVLQFIREEAEANDA
jgi:hypothetical protein